MIDWSGMVKFLGYNSVKEMLLSKYAQTHEQRKDGKLSVKSLARFLSVYELVSGKTVLNKLKELKIPIAPVGGPNFKNTIIDAGKFGFKTEEELLKHWRYKENKSIKEIYELTAEHFGNMSWDWFRRKLGKLGIIKKGTRLEGRLWETGYEKDRGTRYYSDFV